MLSVEQRIKKLKAENVQFSKQLQAFQAEERLLNLQISNCNYRINLNVSHIDALLPTTQTN